MESACRICNNRDNTPFVVREMYFGTRKEFEYFECGACGCLQIGQIPADMGEYYPEGYYSFADIDEISMHKRLKQLFARKRNEYALFKTGFLGKLLYAMRPPTMPFTSLQRFGSLRTLKLLDVGCGSGEFAHCLTELGIDIIGIDPFIAHEITYKNGLKIVKKSLSDFICDTAPGFDLIMFNHSFEHMPEPDETLKAVAGLLKQSGTLMVRIPTVSSYAWKHYRTNWVQLDAPRHLFLHSLVSMELLAHNAGLEISDIVYDSDELQFCGSEQYLKDIPLTSPQSYRVSLEASPFNRKSISRFKQLATELNTQQMGDMAAFYLRKL